MSDFNEMDQLEPNITDTKEETDRKCPQCDGTMNYDPETGKTLCPYCGYEEEISQDEELPPSAEELDFYKAEQTGNCNWGAEKKTVICKNCSAETIYDALDVASECPYCGSNQVMEAQAKDTLAPNGVVPFQISSDVASDNFKKWIGKKFFCPKLAKESARPDSFKGIYLPYWTFDAQTNTHYRASYGKDRRVKDREGNVKIETDWYSTRGTYNEFIDDQLVLASTRHNTGMLKGVEPFNTADNKTYKPEFVAGFLAERYSIGLKDGWELAKKAIHSRLSSAITKKIRHEKNADHVRNLRLSTSYTNITYKYLMLPIWVSSFQYNGKVYQFMVNGQTGKVTGKTPISIWKVIFTILAVILVLLIIFGCVGLADMIQSIFN